MGRISPSLHLNPFNMQVDTRRGYPMYPKELAQLLRTPTTHYHVEFDNEKGEHFEEIVEAKSLTHANIIAESICKNLNTGDPQRMWSHNVIQP